MGISKRHHYIPEFYIKGFTGEDGLLAVYNKEKKRIEVNRKSPKQVFFEWNRNTFKINGEDNDIVEKLYRFGENRFSTIYRNLIEKHEPIELKLYDLCNLIHFISEIHWRVPKQDNESLDYIRTLNSPNSVLKIKDENGINVTYEKFNEIINEPAFVEASKILRAIQNFTELEKNNLINNWKLYYAQTESPKLNLLGDNPLIIKDKIQTNIIESELIFPLSKGKTVYHTKGKTLKEIPAINKFNIDVLTFIQADKLVCCSNSSYLEAISEHAKFYNSNERIQILKNKVFEIFE